MPTCVTLAFMSEPTVVLHLRIEGTLQVQPGDGRFTAFERRPGP